MPLGGGSDTVVDHGMQSVALPLMGSGRAKWPRGLAAQIHIAEALEFVQSGKAGSMVRVRRRQGQPSSLLNNSRC